MSNTDQKELTQNTKDQQPQAAQNESPENPQDPTQEPIKDGEKPAEEAVADPTANDPIYQDDVSYWAFFKTFFVKAISVSVMRLQLVLLNIVAFIMLSEYHNVYITSALGTMFSFYLFFNMIFVWVMMDCFCVWYSKYMGLQCFESARVVFWRGAIVMF